MKPQGERLVRLAEALARRLEEASVSVRASLVSIQESLRVLQGDTADRRVRAIARELEQLEERWQNATRTAATDLGDFQQELTTLTGALPGARALPLLRKLVEVEPSGAAQLGELLLDKVIDAVGADRGFVVFYSPESTEAEIVAARHFETRDLSLGEYTPSRTILRRVLLSAEPVLLDDALGHPDYSQVESVRAQQLRSVVVVPLKHDGRCLGAVYLEDGRRAGAFDAADVAFLELAAVSALACLRRARLLPEPPGSGTHVFLDEQRAAREMIGCDTSLRAALGIIARVADSPATVLIQGESGTGKELLARALHFDGIRRDRPFAAINCAAIPQELLESELFGHEKGAFTGAGERKRGRLEEADGGTVFLDEISELPYAQQAKLLRFLQSGELQRLGGTASRADVRVVAATSKDLRALVDAGRFQDALYYRLNVIPVELPPLRKRPGDIRLLATHFIRRYGELYGRSMHVDDGVFARLETYAFPGNVRELENLVHRLVALATDNWIRAGDLPSEILRARTRSAVDLNVGVVTTPADDTDPQAFWRRKQRVLEQLGEQEARLVERALADAGGSVSQAARRLGVHRVTLHRLLKRIRERRKPDARS
jgi:Nif-specific regulatory protein